MLMTPDPRAADLDRDARPCSIAPLPSVESGQSCIVSAKSRSVWAARAICRFE